MNVEFCGFKLEYSDECFTPTTITHGIVGRIPVKDKEVLEVGCGIGPHSIYYAKNGASKVTATDLHLPHVEYTKLNAKNNDVDINVIHGDLFENITGKFDTIVIDVSGIDRRIAEVTGWFPGDVPTADDTGANIIVRALQDAPNYLKDKGEIYCVTASLSNIDKILEQMDGKQELIYEMSIPFSRRLLANIDSLRPESYFEMKPGQFFWKFWLYKL